MVRGPWSVIHSGGRRRKRKGGEQFGELVGGKEENTGEEDVQQQQQQKQQARPALVTAPRRPVSAAIFPSFPCRSLDRGWHALRCAFCVSVENPV